MDSSSTVESNPKSIPMIALTVALGAVVVLLYMLCGWGRKPSEADADESKLNKETNGVKQHGKKQSRTYGKFQKKSTQNYTHPLLHTSLKGHTGKVLGLDASTNGKYLASCSDDRSVRLWSVKDFASGNKSVHVNVEFDYAVQARFSPDSRAFIAGLSYDNTVRVFRLGKREDGVTTCIPLEEDFPKYNKAQLLDIGVGVSATGGSFVMTAYEDTTVMVRSLKGEVLHSINTNLGNNNHALVSPCGRFVACSGWTPDVKVWAVVFDRNGDYKEVKRAFELKGHTSSVWSFAFNNDSTRMVSVSKDGTWRYYDTMVEYDKGQEPYLLNSGGLTVCGRSMTDSPALVALSADGKVAAVACSNDIAVFSTTSGEKEAEFREVHSEVISALTFDVAGKYLLSAGDRQIRVFYNTLGYKEIIKDLEEKQKKTSLTSATRDRQQKQIDDARKTLAAILKRAHPE